jgi:DNA-binding CsgD family transcriptional regulator
MWTIRVVEQDETLYPGDRACRRCQEKGLERKALLPRKDPRFCGECYGVLRLWVTPGVAKAQQRQRDEQQRQCDEQHALALLRLAAEQRGEASPSDYKAASPAMRPRDARILKLWARGDTDSKIAQALGIDIKTVRNRICDLRKDLGAERVPYHARPRKRG